MPKNVRDHIWIRKVTALQAHTGSVGVTDSKFCQRSANRVKGLINTVREFSIKPFVMSDGPLEITQQQIVRTDQKSSAAAVAKNWTFPIAFVTANTFANLFWISGQHR